jgi:hypothetical protein
MGLRLKINFALESYELTKTAQQHLDELGEEPAVGESILISLQGHTDMYGPPSYHKELSIRRAESAKENLAPFRSAIGIFHVASQRGWPQKTPYFQRFVEIPRRLISGHL